MPDLLEFADEAAWVAWLLEHHETQPEAWLRIGKKNVGSGFLSISEALDGALCFGWIDGQRKGFDKLSFAQRYTRRRARSSWSAVNVEKAEVLISSGRMQPAGFAEIEAAQNDGRWDRAYVSQAKAEVPEDLLAALALDPDATSAFEALGRTARYAVMLPLLKAATPAARARALERAIQDLTQLSE